MASHVRDGRGSPCAAFYNLDRTSCRLNCELQRHPAVRRLRIGPEGGAKIQEIIVNDDCSVTKGEVQVIEPGTAQFERFLASKGTTKANKKHHGGKPAAGGLPPGDPECWSELDYQDVAWANLTQTRLGMPYLYDPGASQIMATYPLDWLTMAGTDGWYLIDQYTTPYSGPLPYGQINAYGQASFAWVAGSFWHQHQNNNYANGFGQCWGYSGQLGSMVPAGRWFWTVWQL